MIGGHGHVTPRPDGARARCGGPGLCPECSREQAAKASSGAGRNRYTVSAPVPRDTDQLEAARITSRLRDELERLAADAGDVLVGDITLALDQGDAFGASDGVLTASAAGAPRDEPAKPSAWRPKVLVDFDGVVHRYSKGWADGTVYDPPMPGASDALAELAGRGYELVVFSTRDRDQIAAWLERWGFPPYRITNVKEAAVALIDDRAIRFVDWEQAAGDLRRLYPVRP
jgi:hypothetical protein